MTQHADITADIRSWDEAAYRELDGGGKLTRATVAQGFAGGLEGEGVMEFLMCSTPDGTSRVIGPQDVVGTIAGRSGSFVLQAEGVFSGGEARWDWSVVPGSGTDGLQGLTGKGTAVAAEASKVAMTFDYEFDVA